jgi:hypothetical protein
MGKERVEHPSPALEAGVLALDHSPTKRRESDSNARVHADAGVPDRSGTRLRIPRLGRQKQDSNLRGTMPNPHSGSSGVPSATRPSWRWAEYYWISHSREAGLKP